MISDRPWAKAGIQSCAEAMTSLENFLLKRVRRKTRLAWWRQRSKIWVFLTEPQTKCSTRVFREPISNAALWKLAPSFEFNTRSNPKVSVSWFCQSRPSTQRVLQDSSVLSAMRKVSQSSESMKGVRSIFGQLTPRSCWSLLGIDICEFARAVLFVDSFVLLL